MAAFLFYFSFCDIISLKYLYLRGIKNEKTHTKSIASINCSTYK